jgi:hypothetical protein
MNAEKRNPTLGAGAGPGSCAAIRQKDMIFLVLYRRLLESP